MQPTIEERNYIHDIYTDIYNIQLKICNRETECYMTIKPKHNTCGLNSEVLENYLIKHKIMIGYNQEKLKEVCQIANRGQPVNNVLVAQGTLPKSGKDAELKFFIKLFSFDPDFNENEKGIIDFKQCNLFENVGVGRRIASWKPAIPGKNGQAVSGEVIPAEKANNFAPIIGPGIESRGEGFEFFSTSPGRVMMRNYEISISQEYLIEKNVDYSIGHIDFVGFVQVRGEVYDGFNIKAKKGIRVYKNVGACILQSQGDIEIGGMSGRDHDAIINCGGNLTAKYLTNVYVECQGDVHIRKEVFNCTIKTKGKLTVGGRIVGGEYTALGGIEARQVGSEIGVKTKLIAGLDYHDISKIKEWQVKLIETKTRWDAWKIQTLSSIIPENIKLWHTLKVEDIGQVFNSFRIIQERENAIKGRLESVREANKEQSNPKINIDTQLSSGTSICLGNVQMEVKDPLKGPKSLIEYCRREILILDKTALTKKARDIELKILQKQAA